MASKISISGTVGIGQMQATETHALLRGLTFD